MTILMRWLVGGVLTLVIVGFSGYGISKKFKRAAEADILQTQLNVEQAERKAEKAKSDADLAAAEHTANEADKRREHWRQSWYKKNDEFEKYKEATKQWIPNAYPAELD